MDLWANEINIHISSNDAKYGNFDKQEATITTADIPFFRNTNVKDWYFKNDSAGSNTVITIVGTRMTKKQMEDQGVI